MDTIATYKGKPIEELTKEELLIFLNEMDAHYKSCLSTKDEIIKLLESKWGGRT